MKGEANPNGSLEILSSLLRALERRQEGKSPAFSRGRMYFDFDLEKVRIAPIGGQR